MIDFQLFSALVTYYFIMFATPRPKNAMLTASGLKFGFVKTLPHLVGIPLGHIFQIGLVCYGLGNLFLVFPELQFYMKILCFIYLLYLGWKIIGSFNFDLTIEKSGDLNSFQSVSKIKADDPSKTSYLFSPYEIIS